KLIEVIFQWYFGQLRDFSHVALARVTIIEIAYRGKQIRLAERELIDDEAILPHAGLELDREILQSDIEGIEGDIVEAVLGQVHPLPHASSQASYTGDEIVRLIETGRSKLIRIDPVFR